MPYEIRKDGDAYLVVNSETGDVKAKHEDKEKAERQVALLHDLEKGLNDGVK